MTFIKYLIGMFSSYVNPFEKKVDKFFKHIKSTYSLSDIRDKLLDLMQENLIVTNVWLEKKFKGYIYLDKDSRRTMYENVEKIKIKFEEFTKTFAPRREEVKEVITKSGLTYPDGADDKMIFLFQIMAFLRPGKYYNYIKTASFGKLLRDPDAEKLEGDCNQIVTMYIYLFSLKFPVEELNIKLLPEHVCLHFRGIDIEATNATFQKYTESKDVLPVTEIISTNLLDLADFREDVQQIEPRVFVKSAQLAYAISSLRPLVEKNLNIAYTNLGIGALNANDFETAIFYISKSNDQELLRKAHHNAAAYYAKNNNFQKAIYYVSKSGDRDLEKNIRSNEAAYYYKKNDFERALKIYANLSDEKMQKACFGGMFNELAKKISSVKTLDDAKKFKSTYREMLNLAMKIGDPSLEENIRSTLSKI